MRYLPSSLLGRALLVVALPLCVLAGLVAAGYGTSILNALSSNSAYERLVTVPYGGLDRQCLDVYCPIDSAEAAPVVLFFYGGGWTGGAKEDFEFVASSFTREGFVVVLPDYRLFPEVTYPSFAEDAAVATTWVRQHIAEYGGDPTRIFVAGHSSGAYLAALVTLDSSLDPAGSAELPPLAGFIGLAGPYDFLPLDEDSNLVSIFPLDLRQDSQPIHHVNDRAALPPVLLAHGTDDDTVFESNSISLAQALEARGVDVTLISYESTGHKRLAAALAAPLDFLGEVRQDTLDWLREHGSPRRR